MHVSRVMYGYKDGALYGSLSNHPRFPQSPLVIGQVDRKLLAPMCRTLDLGLYMSFR